MGADRTGARPGGDGTVRAKRVARILNGLALVGLAGWSVWAYGTLPATYPVHFDVAGRPDRWAEKGPWLWAVLPLLAAVLAVSLSSAPSVARRAPGLLNIPKKARYLDLDEGRRGIVLDRIGSSLEATAFFTTLLLWGLQVAFWNAARTGSVWTEGLVGGTIVYTLALVGGALLLRRRLAEQIEELHRGQRADAGAGEYGATGGATP